jgi:TonB family protein
LRDKHESPQEWVMANAHHIRPVPSSNDEVNLEIDDTGTVRALSEEGHQPPMLVLSRDAGLVETVRKAAPRGTPVTHSPDLDHIADKLPTLQPGVLLVDTGSTADVAAMVAQLTQHFPELVVVVAGKREDSGSLMQLTAAGRIFRFLLTPLSHGQTRLALEAALAQHLDLRASDQRRSSAVGGAGEEKKNYVVTYGALAAGLLVVIGGIWFGVTKFTGEPTPTAVVQPSPAPGAQPGGVPDRPDPVQAELALAKEAFAQGKFLEPAGESALDLYRNALALDPNSEAATAGIRSVVDKVLERAEASLTAERLEEAIRNIETARDIDASHPRLAFLDTQIARERERLKLSQAQEVGNRVRTLVGQANDRMGNGRLIAPAGGSARDALIEARRLDPTDPTVAQGIRELSGMLTDEARKSLAAGKADEAQVFVNGARSLGSAGAQLAAVERSIADASRSTQTAAAATATTRRPAQAPTTPSIDPMIAEVRQRISEGKLIDPAGASAKDSIANLQSQAPGHPAVEELSRALSTRLLDVAKQAMNAKAYDRSSQLIAGAREVGARYNEAGIAQAERDLAAAREATSLQTSVVSAATLKRTKMVAPQYPEAARKRGIEGWVEVSFTVMPNGTVENVEIRNASPAEVFDDAAIRAVRQWRFEPVVRNGEKVQQRAMLRLKFSNQSQ